MQQAEHSAWQTAAAEAVVVVDSPLKREIAMWAWESDQRTGKEQNLKHKDAGGDAQGRVRPSDTLGARLGRLDVRQGCTSHFESAATDAQLRQICQTGE